MFVAQAPNCYYPESPRTCEMVKAATETAVAPAAPAATTTTTPAEVAGAGGSSLSRFAPLGLALPLLGIPLAFVDGDSDGDITGGGTSPNTPGSPTDPGNPVDPGAPQPIPVPTVIPGLILGAGFMWAARKRRAAFIVVPFFLFPVASSPALFAQQTGQELVFPVISGNTITVNYGGKVVSLPAPASMPRETGKYRYFAQAVDGGWKLCWEEVKPLVCPKQLPRRLLGQS